MASSGLELLWVSLPQLGKGAAQTLSILPPEHRLQHCRWRVVWRAAHVEQQGDQCGAAGLPGAVSRDPGAGVVVPAVFRPADFSGLSIPSFWCAVLVLSLWGASEVGEVVRGAGIAALWPA